MVGVVALVSTLAIQHSSGMMPLCLLICMRAQTGAYDDADAWQCAMQSMVHRHLISARIIVVQEWTFGGALVPLSGAFHMHVAVQMCDSVFMCCLCCFFVSSIVVCLLHLPVVFGALSVEGVISNKLHDAVSKHLGRMDWSLAIQHGYIVHCTLCLGPTPFMCCAQLGHSCSLGNK